MDDASICCTTHLTRSAALAFHAHCGGPYDSLKRQIFQETHF